jgi:hypothetical protein
MASLQLSKEEDGSRLITNPYISRMPVTDPTRFYGRHDDILHIAENIRSWQTIAISGEPRIGKTSLLYYLIHSEGIRTLPVFLEYIGNPPADYLFVLIELQRLPVRNAIGFWRYLLDRLTEEASKDAISSLAERKEYATSQLLGNDYYEVQTSFERYLKQLKHKVIFLFDDFDIVINDFANTEVVQVTDKLRTLKEALDLNGWLNYIILSTDPLVRLLKNNGITSPSPFTSIITPMKPLGLLDKEAADSLIQEPLQKLSDASSQFTVDDIDFIYKLAGRHPDFMKITCFYLFAAHSQGNVDYAAVRQQIEDDPHVHWLMNGLWERLKQGEQLERLPLRDVLLQVAQEQKPTNLPALRELSQRGLVEDSNSTPHIFGELFRTFILCQSSSTVVKEMMPPELTHLESKLYSYLVEHIGQTCSREQLEKAIWGNKVPESRDALEQLVKRVRGKLEPNPDRPIYLLNVRRQGYLLRNTPSKLL